MSGSLIATSLELGKDLAEQGKLTLQGTGNCMYPVIRTGDQLHVQACTVEQIQPGEIAVCRARGKLFAHRVIGKTVVNGIPSIITRADTNLQGQDAPVSNPNLLGRVQAVERNGKPVSTAVQNNNWLCLLLRCRLAIRESPLRLRGVIAYLQRTGLYRTLAPTLLSTLRRTDNWAFSVQLPLLTDRLDQVVHRCPVEGFNPDLPNWQQKQIDCWQLTLHLVRDQPPVALANFRRKEKGETDWQLTELRVRLRYRGCGLRAVLINKAEEIYRQNHSRFTDVSRTPGCNVGER